MIKKNFPPKAAPKAPAPFRPNPTPRVLQTKQALHQAPIKGPIGPHAHAAASTVQRIVRPGAPPVKSVAPPVYRPNPAPQVLQRRTPFQPPKPPDATSALVRRAQAVIRPPQAHASGVVQRVVVINQFGKNKQTRTFNVKNSKSQRSYPKSADYLIDLIKDKGFKAG